MPLLKSIALKPALPRNGLWGIIRFASLRPSLGLLVDFFWFSEAIFASFDRRDARSAFVCCSTTLDLQRLVCRRLFLIQQVIGVVSPVVQEAAQGFRLAYEANLFHHSFLLNNQLISAFLRRRRVATVSSDSGHGSTTWSNLPIRFLPKTIPSMLVSGDDWPTLQASILLVGKNKGRKLPRFHPIASASRKVRHIRSKASICDHFVGGGAPVISKEIRAKNGVRVDDWNFDSSTIKTSARSAPPLSISNPFAILCDFHPGVIFDVATPLVSVDVCSAFDCKSLRRFKKKRSSAQRSRFIYPACCSHPSWQMARQQASPELSPRVFLQVVKD